MKKVCVFLIFLFYLDGNEFDSEYKGNHTIHRQLQQQSSTLLNYAGTAESRRQTLADMISQIRFEFIIIAHMNVMIITAIISFFSMIYFNFMALILFQRVRSVSLCVWNTSDASVIFIFEILYFYMFYAIGISNYDRCLTRFIVNSHSR